MNYREHYDRLIQRARNRSLAGYTERHHVLPRCLGGSDEPGNLVALTAREHYVAHLLLCKVYNDHRLWLAVHMMQRASPNQHRSNRLYEHARKRVSEAMRQRNLVWHAANAHPLLGTERSDVTKEKISRSLRARPGGGAAVQVHAYTLAGDYVKSFDSLKEAATWVGRASQTVYSACQSPTRSAGGFRFSYERACTLPSGCTASSRKRYVISNPESRGMRGPPWEVLRKRNRQDLVSVWRQADVVFELLQSGHDREISGLLGTNAHVTRAIKRKIKGGWVPTNDQSWIEFKNEQSNL